MDKIYGNYRARVVDNKSDPMNAGRIKIRVYGIHDLVKTSALPWAQYADSTLMGSLLVPDEGTDVWIFFEMGDIDQPVYFASAPNKPNVPAESQTDYPKNRVIRTKEGITIEINEAKKHTSVTIDNVNFLIDGLNSNVMVTINDVQLLIDGTSSTVKVISDKIQLGKDGTVEQSVLGKQLENWINNTLIPWTNAHRHVSASPGNPTSPPIAPFQAGSAAPNGSVYSKRNTNA